MFNLANENIVKEGFNNIAIEMQGLVNQEMEDMKNITNNFLELKNKVNLDYSEIKELESQLKFLKIQLEDFKMNMHEILIDLRQQKSIEPPKQKIQETLIIESIKPLKQEVDYGDERNWGNCINCGKKQKILNPTFLEGGEGTKRTEGSCCVCGNKLFRIH